MDPSQGRQVDPHPHDTGPVARVAADHHGRRTNVPSPTTFFSIIEQPGPGTSTKSPDPVVLSPSGRQLPPQSSAQPPPMTVDGLRRAPGHQNSELQLWQPTSSPGSHHSLQNTGVPHGVGQWLATEAPRRLSAPSVLQVQSRPPAGATSTSSIASHVRTTSSAKDVSTQDLIQSAIMGGDLMGAYHLYMADAALRAATAISGASYYTGAQLPTTPVISPWHGQQPPMGTSSPSPHQAASHVSTMPSPLIFPEPAHIALMSSHVPAAASVTHTTSTAMPTPRTPRFVPVLNLIPSAAPPPDDDLVSPALTATSQGDMTPHTTGTLLSTPPVVFNFPPATASAMASSGATFPPQAFGSSTGLPYDSTASSVTATPLASASSEGKTSRPVGRPPVPTVRRSTTTAANLSSIRPTVPVSPETSNYEAMLDASGKGSMLGFSEELIRQVEERRNYHKNKEKRRRDELKARIADLGEVLPQGALTQTNSSAILQKAVEYIGFLRKEYDRLASSVEQLRLDNARLRSSSSNDHCAQYAHDGSPSSSQGRDHDNEGSASTLTGTISESGVPAGPAARTSASATSTPSTTPADPTGPR